jgi:electron transfer flavoprotein alpha subunit
MSSILVYALHYDGAFNKNSLGAVSEGARLAGELGGECHAVVVGDKAGLPDELCASLGRYGAAKVYRVEGPEGLAQPVVDAMAKIIGEGGHRYALFGGGLLGFEIGAGLTARLDAGVCMEVTNVRVEDGKLVSERPILQDSQVSDVHYRSDVGVIIGRLNAFEARAAGEGSAVVEDVAVEFEPHSLKARPKASRRSRSSPARSAAPSPRRARSSTPAGTPTRPRSGRPARRWRRSSIWPPASPARSSTRSACRAPRTSSRSTRTPTHRSSSSPTSGSSATSTRSFRSSPRR